MLKSRGHHSSNRRGKGEDRGRNLSAGRFVDQADGFSLDGGGWYCNRKVVPLKPHHMG